MKNFVQTGDNITVLASQCVFPAHAGGDTYTSLVGPGQGLATPINQPEAGDPVLVGGCLVGVVNNDALQSTDSIVISTRGVYSFNVKGTGTSGANQAIAFGDRVYIDPSTAALTADSTKIPFGIALGAVPSGNTTTSIPVKLIQAFYPEQASGQCGGLEVDAASGAIALIQGNVFITKAGVAAMTLAAPTAGIDDNKVLTIISTTANAHTVTTPANKINGNKSVITFGATVGNQVELLAFNGTWFVRNPATADGFTLA